MSNGENDSSNKTANYVEDELQKIVDKIENQYAIFNMNLIKVDTSVPDYVNMTEDEISRLTPEELSQAEIKLASYAFTIQRQTNTANTIKNWADRNLGLIVAKHYDDFDQYTKYEVRRDITVRKNVFATKLYDIIKDAQVTIDSLSYLAQSIQHVSDAFGRLARIRRKD